MNSVVACRISISPNAHARQNTASAQHHGSAAKITGWVTNMRLAPCLSVPVCAAPQACSKYGPCKDEPFPGYECPEDYECKKLNVYWWMCQPIA